MILEKLNNKNFNIEVLEGIQKEYNRIFDELKEKYSKKLVIWYNTKYKPVEAADIVTEKIMLLAKAHFEHELSRVYNPKEEDPVLIKRQDDILLCMLYATEVFLTKHYNNQKIIK